MVARASAPPLKARLGLEQCESREVPDGTPTVTAGVMMSATEGAMGGWFFLSRTGDTSGTLTVSYTVGGTATAGADYTALSGTATFAPNNAFAGVFVDALADSVSDPDETVTLDVQAGAGYAVGGPASATLTITDTTPVITVEKVADATEGGANGTFRFTRTGDTSNSLTVSYTVGGTATSGTDYTALSGSVTFAAGSATADVNVTAATDAVYDPDETVVATLASGTGYAIGAANTATVSIGDNAETVETLIHSQTFQLTGANGNVNVALTVTYNAPGAQGLYTWVYTVTNPVENANSLTSFAIPIDGMDSDVTNLASSLGWTGAAGTAGVSWAAGTALAPGATATFSFTTLPREVGDGAVSASGGGGFFADLPVAPVPRQKTANPAVKVKFFGVPGDVLNYTISLDIDVANGNAYTTAAINFTNVASKQAGRDLLYAFLKNNGWAVEKLGDVELVILGRVEADKSVTALKSLKFKFSNVSTGIGFAVPPAFDPVGQVDISQKP